MPIGGVIACKDAVIPNAVGVDIGCGMGAVKTTVTVEEVADKGLVREVIFRIKELVPCGEGQSHRKEQDWSGMPQAIEDFSDRGWFSDHVKTLAKKNLGSLGGGNHFIEIQAGDDGFVWLMIHSGSRHLGNKIAQYYNTIAISYDAKQKLSTPGKDLAFLPADSRDGKKYIGDMTFALLYARENRRRIMHCFMQAFYDVFPGADFEKPVNIHHNYAALETHFGKKLWVHRKGATSAQKDEIGIIPGSMGTPSYIVKGLGNTESFSSCSHGAGRILGRNQASAQLTVEECDRAMSGIVYDRWRKYKGWKRKKGANRLDLGEAPQAYKPIDEVIKSQLDLIKPLTRLKPMGVVKG
jgi:tRNA-splicing ligase RtcB